MSVDEGDGGRLAVGKLDGEAKAEVGSREAQLVFADLVEEARAVAKDHGHCGDGIPDHVAKAAQARERGVDAVPVGVQGHVLGSADGDEALIVSGDGAGVGDVKLKDGAGGEGLRQRDRGLVQLAGMVGVGVERGYLQRNVLAQNADALPGERGRELERDMAEGSLAVVANGEDRSYGNVTVRGVQTDIHVEVGGGDGLALGVLGGWGGGHLDVGLGWCGRGLRGVAVFAGRAGEDDRAVGRALRLWRNVLLRDRQGGSGGLGRAGSRRETKCKRGRLER